MKKKNLFNVALAGVMLSLLTLVAAPAHAAGPGDISSFVTCLNSITTTSPTVVNAVACVPSPGCYTTLTVSEESAQPGCTLADGTNLPRVIFSCPGSGGSLTLRFRPSFSLCTLAGTIKHIELADDQDLIIDSRRVQKMADVDSSLQVTVDMSTNHVNCGECHDLLRTTSTGVHLLAPIRPAVAEGTIFTNDPRVTAPSVQKSVSDTFTDICNGIADRRQRLPGWSAGQLAADLCSALKAAAVNQ